MKKQPWSTKKVMQQIYELNFWGSNGNIFYSGEGSHNKHITTPYIIKTKEFLTSFTPAISVVDLGCGDFNIGKELVEYTKKYTAIDIVPKLITYNKKEFRADNLEFKCLDIAKNHLPKADCAIVRQVLQHLSNLEIAMILEKLKDFKYIILTEHLPKGKFTPNLDMITDRGNRTKKNSGVVITKPPFNFNSKKEEILVKTKLKYNNGIIETILYTL